MPKRAAKQLSFHAVDRATAEQRKAEREARRRRGGRPKKPVAQRGVTHAQRPAHSSRPPVHVTVRVASGVPSLRTRKVWPAVREVLLAAPGRFRQMFCIGEYSVQSNHVHLVVEAHDGRGLSRGMQGFGIRLAKNLRLPHRPHFRLPFAVLDRRVERHVGRVVVRWGRSFAMGSAPASPELVGTCPWIRRAPSTDAAHAFTSTALSS